jgi:hypothetical protein
MSAQERDQNFWQTASITGTALGIPGMIIGGLLAKQHGAGSALLSICLGNFILWIVGLGIISMAENRQHAIENIKNYLGKVPSTAIAIMWMASFIVWYALQIKGISDVFHVLYPFEAQWGIGAILGVITALLCISSIRFIKWISIFSLPILISLAIYGVFVFIEHPLFKTSWAISFDTVVPVILVWLPFGVNLPTFIRHSRSKADSILSLSLMTLIHIFFQSIAALLFMGTPEEVVANPTFQMSGLSALGIISFSIIAYICVNVLNIYCASAAWEMIVPKHESAKERLIIGIVGTGLFIILQTGSFHTLPSSIEVMIAVLTACIANLSITLLMAFLIRMIVHHRPRPLEKLLSSLSWIIGCATMLFFQNPNDTIPLIITGIGATVLSFIIIILIEESIWSIRGLSKLKSEP